MRLVVLFFGQLLCGAISSAQTHRRQVPWAAAYDDAGVQAYAEIKTANATQTDSLLVVADDMSALSSALPQATGRKITAPRISNSPTLAVIVGAENAVVMTAGATKKTGGESPASASEADANTLSSMLAALISIIISNSLYSTA
eukprot:TRINITY_DN37988_c0_g1_i1.p2 TRINITY_DN37988_c0_g1~~TRINITY_DN37988_c0_g1_i1.p2  ORF type:complete len:144 (-),score=16.09 TRINITY_DN37988_c0_g1_i1:664-1095(-)